MGRFFVGRVSLVITHIFMRANIHFSLFDREAVQDSSRRSRSAPTDRVQINLNRPRRASQIGAIAQVCDPLRGRKHGIRYVDRRCATRPTATVCDPFRIKKMWVMTRSPDPTASGMERTGQETQLTKKPETWRLWLFPVGAAENGWPV